MNTFAVIEEIEDFCFKRVRYYSVRFEHRKYNEFEDFLLRHQKIDEIQEEFQDLFLWLEKIGDETGALQRYFRHEGKADALPPPASFLEIEYHEHLRLYCMRISNEIVILFNGSIKSKEARTAQECKKVRPFFNLANKLVAEIDKLINQRQIKVHCGEKKLLFDENLILPI